MMYPDPRHRSVFARRPNRHRAAFTLVELLVVIGIIAVLMSILMPAIGRMRDQAKGVKCLSNVRQMLLAQTLYNTSSQDRLIPYQWYTPDNPDRAWDAFWIGLLDGAGAKEEIRLCPSAEEPTPNVGGGGGTAVLAWSGQGGPPGTSITYDGTKWRTGSYGHNGWLYTASTDPNGDRTRSFGEKITQVRNASEVPIFYDSRWVDGWFKYEVYTPPPNLLGTAQATDAGGHFWLMAFARHGRGINVGFCDGSARRVEVDGLYELRWSKNWVPRKLVGMPRK